jgi:CO/xanthine dehydrogenase Mo-binding subunit
MCQQWNAAIVEVEVDTDTGEVEVLKIWVAEDVGRIIFRKGLENQQYGGSIMSMGRGLYEGIVKDDATGVTLNPNYLDYKLPSMADIPDYDIDLYETYATNPFGPMGAKGVGEPMVGGTAPAVANAIYNACGARVYSTMITPNKILKAIGKG